MSSTLFPHHCPYFFPEYSARVVPIRTLLPTESFLLTACMRRWLLGSLGGAGGSELAPECSGGSLAFILLALSATFPFHCSLVGGFPCSSPFLVGDKASLPPTLIAFSIRMKEDRQTLLGVILCWTRAKAVTQLTRRTEISLDLWDGPGAKQAGLEDAARSTVSPGS